MDMDNVVKPTCKDVRMLAGHDLEVLKTPYLYKFWSPQDGSPKTGKCKQFYLFICIVSQILLLELFAYLYESVHYVGIWAICPFKSHFM